MGTQPQIVVAHQATEVQNFLQEQLAARNRLLGGTEPAVAQRQVYLSEATSHPTSLPEKLSPPPSEQEKKVQQQIFISGIVFGVSAAAAVFLGYKLLSKGVEAFWQWKDATETVASLTPQ